MKKNIILLVLALCMFSCTTEEINEDTAKEEDVVIEYNSGNSIIENTLVIDWQKSKYSNSSLSLESGYFNTLYLEADKEDYTDSSGQTSSKLLGYKYLRFLAEDDNGKTIFKMTVGEVWGSNYLEIGKVYDLSKNENRKDVILNYFGKDLTQDIIFSANYNKNTVYNTNGLGTFIIKSITTSDDNNNMNDIIEIEFNDLYLYDRGIHLNFSGTLKGNIYL